MALFTHRGRGLLDFIVCAICIFAAWHHTPAGAVVRKVGGWVWGSPSTARPLLAYYGGATGLEIETSALPSAPPRFDDLASVQRRFFRPDGSESVSSLAYGVFAASQQLSPTQRSRLEARAAEEGIPVTSLKGPEGHLALLEKLQKTLQTDEAAVLAAFAGRVPVTYAKERVLAEQEPLTLDRLQAHLPPGLEAESVAAAQALAFATAYDLRWPVVESTRISSPFGYRLHPVLGTRKLHTGIDLAVPIGTEVRSVAPGIVQRASSDQVNGRVLVIDHGRGVRTAYCHNDALLVNVGERIDRGTVVALSGNTGRSTGPHLHYQLEITDQPVDPLRFRSAATSVVSDL